MNMDFKRAFDESRVAFQSVIDQQDTVKAVLEAIVGCIDQGGKVIWLGNGGSAADAQHMAAELMVRYVKNRQPIASIALTTDSSILTAHSNDYEFASVFARQLQGLAKPGDVVMAMSTSGNSENVVQAVQTANAMQCISVALTGKKTSRLSELAHFNIKINSNETARIQEAHSFFNHLLCEGLDSVYAK